MFRNTTSDPPRSVTLAHGQPLAPGEDGPADPDLDRALIEAGDLTQLAVDEDDWTGLTVADVLQRVGDDQALAGEALAFENSQDKPRSTLVSDLERIVNTTPDEEST